MIVEWLYFFQCLIFTNTYFLSQTATEFYFWKAVMFTINISQNME